MRKGKEPGFCEEGKGVWYEGGKKRRRKDAWGFEQSIKISVIMRKAGVH